MLTIEILLHVSEGAPDWFPRRRIGLRGLMLRKTLKKHGGTLSLCITLLDLSVSSDLL